MDTNARCSQYPLTDPSTQASDRAMQRERQIKFLKLVLMDTLTLDEAARAIQVDPSTLDRYQRDFLADDQEDTDDLRKLMKARKYWRNNT